MYSMNVDWNEAIEDGKWDFVGQESYSDKQRENDQELGFPMMNYAYPISYFDGDVKTIRKVCQTTSCTIVYNNEEDKYYLALTGGGMDLSQDIAKAYMLIGGYIEWELLPEVCLTEELSVGSYWFKKILKQAVRQFKIARDNDARNLKQAQDTLARLKNV